MMVKIFCHLHIFLLRLFQAFYYYNIRITTHNNKKGGFAVLPLRSALCNAILDKMNKIITIKYLEKKIIR
jgi:hypothetical protein